MGDAELGMVAEVVVVLAVDLILVVGIFVVVGVAVESQALGVGHCSIVYIALRLV